MSRWIIIATALVGLAAIVSGAYITSVGVALQPGQAEPTPDLHRIIAFLGIAVAIAAPLARGRSRPQLNALIAALLALITSAAIGWNHPLFPAAAVAHASVSHVFTAAIALALLVDAPKPKERIAAGAWTALRPVALWTPAAVFVQIVLGALYRHQITGIMPHMLGAMVVALLTIVVSAILLQHFSQSPALKRAAAVLMTAVLLQICLGTVVFLLLLLNASNTGAFVWIATAHVTTGTLVFAASIFVAIEVRRHLL